MKMSRTVAYAVQAVLQLARSEPGVPVPCGRLASEGKMPERFLLQILRTLVAHGVLSSTRGVDGGYVLQRPPEEMSLLDVIEAIDGPMICTFPPSEGLAEQSQVKLQRVLSELAELSRRQLAAVKVVQLLPNSAE